MKSPDEYTSRGTLIYREWADKVLQKSAYLCAECGSKEYVVPHHIKNWNEFPALRYDVDNGVALCRSCHSVGKLNGYYSTGKWTKVLKPCIMCHKESLIYNYQNCCSYNCGYNYRELRRQNKNIVIPPQGQFNAEQIKDIRYQCNVLHKKQSTVGKQYNISPRTVSDIAGYVSYRKVA